MAALEQTGFTGPITMHYFLHTLFSLDHLYCDRTRMSVPILSYGLRHLGDLLTFLPECDAPDLLPSSLRL